MAFPACLPAFASVQYQFHAWRDNGVLDRMMDALRAHAREPAGRSEEPTAAAAGSRSAKATESGGPSGHDAGKKIKGRTRHVTADVEGFPVMIAVHEASVQDRDGAPGDPRHAGEGSAATKPWADGGHAGPKPEAGLAGRGPGPILETVRKPKEARGFAVIRRRVAERTFAWMSRCRRPAKDHVAFHFQDSVGIDVIGFPHQSMDVIACFDR